MKVVFIAPHPDDLEFFAGGAAIKHSIAGDETVELVLTRGELGAVSSWVSGSEKRGLAEKREMEAREGASILGVSKIRFLGFGDSKVDLSKEVRERIGRAVEAENPDLIYVPDPEFTFYKHSDHLVAGRIIEDLFKEVPKRLYHTTKPNLEIDISGVYERKMRAIKNHQSQKFILFYLPILLVRDLRRQRRDRVERFRFRKGIN